MKYSEEFKNFCRLLGKNIEKVRKKECMTLEELSKITEIKKEYLKKIENGTAYEMKLVKHTAKISSALKVKLSDLFDY